MAYRIACSCGKGVFAEATDAGARLTCGCGRAVVVPNLSVLRRMTPVARRADHTPTKWPHPDTEANRYRNTGLWTILVGVVLLIAGLMSSMTEKSPGVCLDLLGVGAIILGVLRLGRGILQRRFEK